MLIGVLGILISPFAALFQKSGNKGFTGNLRILFYKNGDSQIYDYHLLGTRKGEAFESKEQVFQIKMKKYMAILISPQGDSYCIPLRQLDTRQIEKLKQISKDVYQFRGKPVEVETICLDNDKASQDVFDEEQKEQRIRMEQIKIDAPGVIQTILFIFNITMRNGEKQIQKRGIYLKCCFQNHFKRVYLGNAS